MKKYDKNTKSAFSKALTEDMRSDWSTPPAVCRALDGEFHFTLDACARADNALCSLFFTKEQNGLMQSWRGHRVYCCPPSGRKSFELWTEKSSREALQKDTIVVMLLPASTDAGWFHKYILNQPGVVVRFLDHRIPFENSLTPSYALDRAEDENGKKKAHGGMRPSMVVIFTGKKRKFRVESMHIEY